MTPHAATHHTAGHGLHRSSPVASLPPHRRGRLRNGAEPGDFLTAPRCGAHTRAGGCCRQPAMHNGRCRLHGGLSTGPRTAQGRARCARARLKHGTYSAATRTLMAEGRAHFRRVRTLLGGRATAGHGVLRSKSISRLSPRAVHLLAHTALRGSFSAGHGVLRSLSTPGQFQRE